MLSCARLAKGFTGADTLLAIKQAMRMAILQEEEVTLHHLKSVLESFKPSTIRNTMHGSVEVPKVH